MPISFDNPIRLTNCVCNTAVYSYFVQAHDHKNSACSVDYPVVIQTKKHPRDSI